ncbi:hypothetical protein DR999_PMT00571 [Platysternon megacephalum]|uniref:Uncharacterized protein n=1 Tax=Platysternon megacephalum TaxID=55544 RepID=A0A4D9F8L8_9SAUR|nr:hypothetical protein DR999_PMT00571 [Platysternon megacephalum]
MGEQECTHSILMISFDIMGPYPTAGSGKDETDNIARILLHDQSFITISWLNIIEIYILYISSGRLLLGDGMCLQSWQGNAIVLSAEINAGLLFSLALREQESAVVGLEMGGKNILHCYPCPFKTGAVLLSF